MKNGQFGRWFPRVRIGGRVFYAKVEGWHFMLFTERHGYRPHIKIGPLYLGEQRILG